MKITPLEKDEILKTIQETFSVYSVETKDESLEIEITENYIPYKKFRELKKFFENKGYLIFSKKNKRFKHQDYNNAFPMLKKGKKRANILK